MAQALEQAGNQKRKTKGLGGLRFDETRGKYIATFELPPDPRTGRRRRREVSAATEVGAIAKMNAAKEAARRGGAGETGRSKGTLAEWLTTWLGIIAKEGTRPSTCRSYRSVIENHVIPHIGKKKLAELTTDDIRYMKDAILTNSTPNRARYAHVVLTKALSDALNDERIDRNVASLVKKQTVIPDVIEALSDIQAMRVIKTAVDAEDPLATRWAAALMLGSRQGETLGLQWDRVDLVKGRVLLNWQLQLLDNEHGCIRRTNGDWSCGQKVARNCPMKRLVVEDGFEYEQLHGALCLTRPKTEMSKRWTYMPPQLTAALKFHRLDTQNDFNPHNLVWTTVNGQPHIPRKDYDNWHIALDRAGVPRVGVHSARHTTASLLAAMGIEDRIIQSILGHTQATTTHRYIHIPEADQQKAMQKLDVLMSGFQLTGPEALVVD